MKRPSKLYKTTIVIWTDDHPELNRLEIDDLARDAICGDAYCSLQTTEEVTDKEQFPDTDFFGTDEEDEEDE